MKLRTPTHGKYGFLIGRVGGVVLALSLVVPTSAFAAAKITGREIKGPTATNNPAATLHSPGTNSAPALPPALNEIARMAEAKVGPQALKAYIDNSPVAYHANAEQIIALKKRGVSDAVIAALLKHGAKLQARLEKARHARLQRWRARHYPWPNPYAMPNGFAPYAWQGRPWAGYGYGPWTPYGPMIAFNNSYPTYINGQPVYSGYYVPGYGYLF